VLKDGRLDRSRVGFVEQTAVKHLEGPPLVGAVNTQSIDAHMLIKGRGSSGCLDGAFPVVLSKADNQTTNHGCLSPKREYPKGTGGLAKSDTRGVSWVHLAKGGGESVRGGDSLNERVAGILYELKKELAARQHRVWGKETVNKANSWTVVKCHKCQTYKF